MPKLSFWKNRRDVEMHDNSSLNSNHVTSILWNYMYIILLKPWTASIIISVPKMRKQVWKDEQSDQYLMVELKPKVF